MDAPCLQRLLTYPQQGPPIIKVSGASKLEVLGYISNTITTLEIGSMILKVVLTIFWNCLHSTTCLSFSHVYFFLSRK